MKNTIIRVKFVLHFDKSVQCFPHLFWFQMSNKQLKWLQWNRSDFLIKRKSIKLQLFSVTFHLFDGYIFDGFLFWMRGKLKATTVFYENLCDFLRMSYVKTNSIFMNQNVVQLFVENSIDSHVKNCGEDSRNMCASKMKIKLKIVAQRPFMKISGQDVSCHKITLCIF